MEWWYTDLQARALSVGFYALALPVFMVIYSALSTPGPNGRWAALASPGMWLFALVLAVIGGATGRHAASAGAAWLMDHHKRWVKTYELTKIWWTKDPHQGDVHLRDTSGREMKIPMRNLWLNTNLWALVYNGIRHSVANGAEVNDGAADNLELHDILEWRDHSA